MTEREMERRITQLESALHAAVRIYKLSGSFTRPEFARLREEILAATPNSSSAEPRP